VAAAPAAVELERREPVRRWQRLVRANDPQARGHRALAQIEWSPISVTTATAIIAAASGATDSTAATCWTVSVSGVISRGFPNW
jgi:hypothetical protein